MTAASQHQPLSRLAPSGRFLAARCAVSLVVQLVVIVGSQCLAVVMAQHQPWFRNYPLYHHHVTISTSPASALGRSIAASDENYAVFSLSLFQYLAPFVVFSPGPPHLRRIWTNFGLLLSLLLNTIVSLVIVLNPPQWLETWMKLKMAPEFEFRLAILSLAVFCFLLSLALEFLVGYCFQHNCIQARPPAPYHSNLNLSRNNVSSVALNILYKPGALNAADASPFDHSFRTEACVQSPTATELPILNR